MAERQKSPCERYGSTRINVREIPLGPMPGFPMRVSRCIVNIKIPNERFKNEALLHMAIEQKDRVLSWGKYYCGMAFHFWTEQQAKEKLIGKEEAAAVIDYAPGGEWRDAWKAKIGDYSEHSFKVICNETEIEMK